MTSRYEEVYASWQDDPEAYWAKLAEDVTWFKPWDKVLDASRENFSSWFVGGELNTCYNAVDRHVEEGRGDQAALIYDSPITGSQKTYTYAQLLSRVARFAGVLRGLGVEKGDRVIIYMPMVPQTVVAILACARLGAVHSVVFGGFAAAELAHRIDDAKPKVIVSGSCGVEPGRIVEYKPLLDAAIDMSSHKPDACVIYQRPQARAEMIEGRDIDWKDAMHGAERVADCVPVAATDPLYILYTSGTTGEPKGVVHDNGGHLVALKWTMSNIYGVEPGEVFWAASDLGWAVGHSYIVYAPLFQGCTTILFEGKPVGTPDAGVFWRIISEHKVKVLFTAPTAFRAIKREDPKGEFLKKYDLTHFKHLFLAGERADPDTLKWAEDMLGVPVIDHWWQTETAWPIATNYVGLGLLPVKHGSPTKAVPGYDVRIVDENANEVPDGDSGAIVIKLPLPPGCLPTLWNKDQRFVESYLSEFPGFYQTGDAGYKDADGYIYVMSRTDDIINVAGHRLSTGQMEEVISAHRDVAECAVVGVADQLKGQLPVGFAVLKAGVNRPAEEIPAELVAMMREAIGPVAAYKTTLIVDRLPKTRSGKILRNTIRKIADSTDYKMPATIEDPTVLDEITATLKAAGYAAASKVPEA
jgi:propionyl-CoA synthetase